MHGLFMLVAIVACLAGSYMLNHNGGLSHNRWGTMLGVVVNILSLSLTIVVFGTLRGVFIYLGMVSLLGLLYTLVCGWLSVGIRE